MTQIRIRQSALAFTILLFIALPVASLSASLRQSNAVLEIVHEGQLEGGWHSTSTRIFADGRVINEGKLKRRAKSGRYVDVSSKTETLLEAEELAEVMGFVERTDFLNAEANYGLRVVQDNPPLTTVTFRKEGLEKKVSIGSYLISSEAEKAQLPPSLVKLIEWSRKYLHD
jgi:hypothetical protein